MIYEIDFDKVKTLNDVIALLRCLDMQVNSEEMESVRFAGVAPYLKPVKEVTALNVQTLVFQ